MGLPETAVSSTLLKKVKRTLIPLLCEQRSETQLHRHKPMSFIEKSKRLESAHNDNIWALTWCQGDLLSAGLDGTMKLWDVSGLNLSDKYDTPSRRVGITSIAAVQDGSVAVICHENSDLRFFDIINKTELCCVNTGLLEAWSICLSPGDDVLASGNNRGEINIWSMSEAHEKVATLVTNNKFILSTTFSIDGKLAAAGIDGMVNLFDMNTQQIFHKLEAHALPIRSVVFSPSGDLLYTASDDRHVSFTDVRTGQIINSFSHAGMALSVDASPDQRHFAVGSADNNVYVWDLGMQKCVKKFESAHNDRVSAVSYDRSDATGVRFASGGDDGLIQLYDKGTIAM